MRIRFWLYGLFGAFSMFPLLFLGIWIHNNSVSEKLAEAGKNQIAMARSISQMVQDAFLPIEKILNSDGTFASDGFASSRSVYQFGKSNLVGLVSINPETQLIDQDFFKQSDLSEDTSFKRSSIIGADAISNFPSYLSNATGAKINFSGYYSESENISYIHAYRKIGNRIILSAMNASFLDQLATNTAIGRGARISIFDAQGKMLNQATEPWQDSLRSVLQGRANPRLMGEDTYIEYFNLPGSDTKMVAAISEIPLTGWKIVVAQSAAEITAGAGLARQSVSIVMVLTLALVLLASILFADMLSKPLEQLISALRRTGTAGDFTKINIVEGTLVTAENRDLQENFNEMIQRISSHNEHLSRLAFSDPVTGLPNREAFRVNTETELSKLLARNQTGTLIFIDIDNFKEINDTLGHNIGDQVLKGLGSRLAGIVEMNTGFSAIQPANTVDASHEKSAPRPTFARFGGDEFTLFIPETCGLAQLDDLLSQIMAAVSLQLPGIETSISLSSSIGLANFPEHGFSYADLVKRADIAMYHAKKLGKNRIQRFGDGTGELSAAEIRRDVQKAIHKGEMELFYQPKVSAKDGDVQSVEALIRWIHPTRGIVSPGEFIPTIENSDITNELGEWVIAQACRDMKTFEETGHKLDIAVNISARQFISEDFEERLLEITKREGCEPHRLEIEVTEETALSGEEGAANIIGRLHKAGFRVSLDDYGRGYSNLTRLSDLRVNTIKIDGPLTARLTRDERTRVIFEATINMAKGLNCKTIAEGVETAEEVAILSRLGINELQGFYYSTPLPVSAMNNWLRQRKANPTADMQEQIRSRLA